MATALVEDLDQTRYIHSFTKVVPLFRRDCDLQTQLY